MSFVALAIGGSAVLGYLSSKKASGAQSEAANQAAGISQAQYEQNREDLSPWRTSGETANARLMQYLGLGVTGTGPVGTSPTAPTRAQFTTTTPGTAEQWLGTGQYDRGGEIRRWQPAAPGTSTFDQAGFDAATSRFNQPAVAGQAGLPAGYGSLLVPFTGTDLVNEPGYQFGLQQGEQGINRAAASRGSYDSGATLKALTRFNQDYGGTKYGDAFNRDAANKQSIYGMLSGVSGTGANAAGQTAGLGANAANMQGQYATNAGDARASGYVGGANAITGGVGSYLGYQNDQKVLEYLRGLRQPIASRSAYNSDFTLR